MGQGVAARHKVFFRFRGAFLVQDLHDTRLELSRVGYVTGADTVFSLTVGIFGKKRRTRQCKFVRLHHPINSWRGKRNAFPQTGNQNVSLSSEKASQTFTQSSIFFLLEIPPQFQQHYSSTAPSHLHARKDDTVDFGVLVNRLVGHRKVELDERGRGRFRTHQARRRTTEELRSRRQHS
jgi:hypothetical protein